MSRLLYRLKWPIGIIFTILCVLSAYFFNLAKNQGLSDSSWKDLLQAQVDFDSNGIPTIIGKDWESIITAQGFVHASDRLWQMDLMRRKTAGELSEWFGEKTFETDKQAQLEDRRSIAKKSVQLLPLEEKNTCEAYTKGVNLFISNYKQRWGIEYIILRKP